MGIMNSRMVMVGLIVLAVGSTNAFAESGRALIQGIGEYSTGTATLSTTGAGKDAGLQVVVRVSNSPPGKHGLHIHQYGNCNDSGNAAGGHYNPDNVPHGFLPSDGLARAHPGDLGNIEVGPDGSGSLSVVLPGVSLSGGQYAVAGRAIVLHEKPDDFGQPTGNAGSRIGCGTILITKEE